MFGTCQFQQTASQSLPATRPVLSLSPLSLSLCLVVCLSASLWLSSLLVFVLCCCLYLAVCIQRLLSCAMSQSPHAHVHLQTNLTMLVTCVMAQACILRQLKPSLSQERAKRPMDSRKCLRVLVSCQIALGCGAAAQLVDSVPAQWQIGNVPLRRTLPTPACLSVPALVLEAAGKSDLVFFVSHITKPHRIVTKTSVTDRDAEDCACSDSQSELDHSTIVHCQNKCFSLELLHRVHFFCTLRALSCATCVGSFTSPLWHSHLLGFPSESVWESQSCFLWPLHNHRRHGLTTCCNLVDGVPGRVRRSA